MDFPLMTFVSTTPAPVKSTDELILELQGADREYRSLRAIADRGAFAINKNSTRWLGAFVVSAKPSTRCTRD